MDQVKVVVDQVWQDNDPRCEGKGRLLVVEKIVGDHAICYQQGKQAEKRRTKIKLSRFRPISTGYRLVTP